jgi:hypothetical protein
VLAEHAMEHAGLGLPAHVRARSALALAVGSPPCRLPARLHAARS